MEKTNFYDAVYSPVILILNAIVVAVVMLLSASGNPTVLKLFGICLLYTSVLWLPMVPT